MDVIGVAGQAQFGKDTLADRLHLKLNERGGIWKRSAFATAVKEVFCDTFNVDMQFIEKWKVIPEPPPGFDMPVRQALQFIGDGFRRIRSDIWLEIAFRNNENPLIISDVRYINEFTRIKQKGGLNIIVARPDKINNDPNESEAQIRPYVDWLLKHFSDEEDAVVDLRNLDWDNLSRINKIPPPDNIELFDIFVCNCSNVENFYKHIDENVVSICERFFFNYLQEK